MHKGGHLLLLMTLHISLLHYLVQMLNFIPFCHLTLI